MTRSAFALYKQLMRSCQKLPEQTRPYYENHVRQGFKQHSEETDPDRIQQIIEKALKDADWVINKVKHGVRQAETYLSSLTLLLVFAVFDEMIGTPENSEVVIELSVGVVGDVVSRFSSAMAVYLGKSHVINRRIVGTIELLRFTDEHPYDPVEALDFLTKMVGSSFPPEQAKFLDDLEKSGLLTASSLTIFRRFIPRCELNGLVGDIVVMDGTKYHFIPWMIRSCSVLPDHWVSPTLCYEFSLSQDQEWIVLKSAKPVDEKQQKMRSWLAERVTPKLVNWLGDDPTPPTDSKLAVPTSLRQVDMKEYADTYESLKQKHVDMLRTNWIGSAPDKDIFEELGIAAYLITLWKKLEPPWHRPSFVDLGCGNGLLSYLLVNEGYPGRGIDGRVRKLWGFFDRSQEYLQEGWVEPHSVYPGVDWILGNHCDELTPWVPVIAHRSGPRTKFFLLPCCPFDFYGKYGRNGRSRSLKTETQTGGQQSTYADFKGYVKTVGQDCGFEILTDKLRIPSTKRECLIGVPVNCEELARREIQKDIDQLLSDPNLGRVFKEAKQSSTVVRNCTKCDRDLVASVVRKIFNWLLESQEPAKHSQPIEAWSVGGSLEISEIVSRLRENELQEMKSQCGGLRTLLKNHGYIFKCVGRHVELNPPRIRETPCPADKFKSKACFYHFNHPNGCPLDELKCSFSHA